MEEIIKDWEGFFIEITNQCNFDCMFCTSGISNREKVAMNSQLAFNLIEQLHRLGFSKKLYFHVLGEPLLHPAVFEIVNYAADAGMKPVIFTNGGVLTKEVTRGILNSKAYEVVVSMQTINQPSYEKIRKTPFQWDEYLQRIQNALVAANHGENNPNKIRFRVSMGIKKIDPEHPEDLYFLEYESIDAIKKSITNIFIEIDKKDLSSAFSQLDTHELSQLPIIQISELLYLSVKPMGNWCRMWLNESSSSGRCWFFGKELAVLSNGSVVFCHNDFDGRTTIGNINEKSLADIIGTHEIRQMIDDFYIGKRVARGCEFCRGIQK